MSRIALAFCNSTVSNYSMIVQPIEALGENIFYSKSGLRTLLLLLGMLYVVKFTPKSFIFSFQSSFICL